MDCSDHFLESTYLRRASQLVKKQRADWISENTIRMKLQYVEDKIMTTESMVQGVDSTSNISSDEKPKNQTPDDNTILELAKRRLAIKKNLLSQIFDYLLILMCFALFAMIWDYETKVFICIIFSLLWGIRLLYRIFIFVKPSFKEGIAEYIKRRNDDQLESEFNRIKRQYMNNR